jgi:hypothetical protein
MYNTQSLEVLFVAWSFLFQLILIIHFALRKWQFDLAIRYGWIVYALSIPAAAISIIFLMNGQNWYFWLGGFIYLIWAIYGYTVEYIRQIQWRSPVRWSILGPYVTLYLATVMFYWWPLALIYKPLWYAYVVLFVTSTILNVSSHQTKSQFIPLEGRL